MPAAKVLSGQVSPQLLAGLLYLGSGTGLLLTHAASSVRSVSKPRFGSLRSSDLPWLFGVVVFGGLIAPLLLMFGLIGTAGSAASLLLNLEAVFTALLAWFVFKENFDSRIFLGMVAIVAGGAVLVARPDSLLSLTSSSLLIVGACLCWGIDNNLTRKISDADPVVVAAVKGLVAGSTNTLIALSTGASLPAILQIASIAMIGFLGYGLSLVLFIIALRHLGTSRTSAYFSTAPFSGTVLSIALLHEPVTGNLLFASILMGVGVWLHISEHHEHEHTHEEDEHEHLHSHDEHHQHDHSPDDPAGEPHVHRHKHQRLTHIHKHFPDTHHRHSH